jgi:hypothetical protein
MQTLISSSGIMERCITTVTDSDNAFQRRDALLILYFMVKDKPVIFNRVVNLAERTLKADSDAEVRRHAAWVLKYLDVEESLDKIAEALGDEDWLVRLEAVEALAAVDDEEEAIAALLRALGDTQPPVRLRAAYHLAIIASDEVRTEIGKLIPEWLEDPDSM